MRKYTTAAFGFLMAGILSQAAVAAPATTASGRTRFAAGLASDNVYISENSRAGFTALLIFSNRTALQMYFGIHTITPALEIGGGANFKYTMVGDSIKGLHIGIGASLGSLQTATFFVNIAPLLGLHFPIADRVLINLDGSLAFKIQTAGSNLNLSLGGNSAVLGASILFEI
jgi:hypothetical protein